MKRRHRIRKTTAHKLARVLRGFHRCTCGHYVAPKPRTGDPRCWPAKQATKGDTR